MINPHFDKEEVCLIERHTEYIKAPAGSKIFTQGEKNRYIVLIKDGIVKAVASDCYGNETILALNSKNEICGLTGFFSDGEYSATVYALTEVVFAKIDHETFMAIIKESASLMYKFYSFMDHFIASYIEKTVKFSSRYTIGSKLAYTILYLCDKFGIEKSDGTTFVQCKVTDELIGDMIGVSRETVARAMSDFRKKGWIHKKGGWIIVYNKKKLQDIALENNDMEDLEN